MSEPQWMWFSLTGWVLFDPSRPPRRPGKKKRRKEPPESPIKGDVRRPVGHESYSPEWKAHLERLAARAKAGLPTATGRDVMEDNE